MKKSLSAGKASIAAIALLGLTAGNAAAQAPPKYPVVVRMFTGPDGLSHSEELPIPMEFKRAVGVRFGQAKASAQNTRTMEWHTAPHERYVVTISGATTIELSDGTVITADPGHILLANDFTGKGHRDQASPVGPEPWVYVFLEINEKP